jgi:replicative DNA helicase
MSDERRIYNVGKTELFNAAALTNAKQPVFIVEGAIDALSVIDQGGEAVGMGGTSGVNKVLEAVRKAAPKQPLVILPDNDNAGEEAAKRLAAGLEELQISFKIVHLPDIVGDQGTPIKIKDANDALRYCPSALRELIEQVSNTVEEAEDEALDAILSGSVLFKLQSIKDSIRTRKLEPFVATGFDSLDKLLGQGLFPGLYFVGATSSLGKTSFCLQLADQIAAQGVDVLYFSLEMATEELVAKSISRLSFTGDMNRNGVSSNAKTTRGVLRGYADYNPEEKRLIDEAFQAYAADVAPFLYITEGIGNIGVQDIRAAVARHTAGTGRKPVVIIDYLQILAPIDFRATDKQNTDKAVLELKRISRDFDIPVIGISSFNRENYRMPVDMNSFKESGAIEYGSDVLIGMQLEGWDYVKGESDATRLTRLRELKEENQRLAEDGQPQRVQLKILKNRTGGRGDCVLEFNPMFNHYGEPYSVSFAGLRTDAQQGLPETRTTPRKRGRASLEDNIRAVAETPSTGLVRGFDDVQLELIHSSESDSE